MENITKQRLRQIGWYENRQINIEKILECYLDIGMKIPINVCAFLEEYGMLSFDDTYKKEDIEFNPNKAIGCNLDVEYFQHMLEDYGIDEMVYPIGVMCRGNLTILMTENNEFYCFTDGYLEKAGNSVEEMLDCLVGECVDAIEII